MGGTSWGCDGELMVGKLHKFVHVSRMYKRWMARGQDVFN